MRITNQQKKELSSIFNQNELNLLDFEASGSYQEFKIKFKFDYFSFNIIKTDKDQYQITIQSIDNTNAGTTVTKWDGVIHRFKLWSNEISSELNTPNGWGTFENENYLNTDYDDLNKSFSKNEKESIRQSLKYIKKKVKTLDVSSDTLKIIEHKLDELDTKVDDLKKFDWKSLFIGTIASLIMSLGITPESAGMLWEMIKSSFSGLKLKG
ncbi:hypothetical protein M4I21_05900 [Cellulophaga sp. 20_2_10]|uniref:hypothetical protein n=1 Tax=Cellulophaga sp. 20_2_10 TaxID=2942476 RepID=UPI00201A32C0|nr:hypothetical protein [Cellulophaga sp. 20_2_10]MCL5245332.1 hypothetical protein [Cellulophaga sp. 20_2_10]